MYLAQHTRIVAIFQLISSVSKVNLKAYKTQRKLSAEQCKEVGDEELMHECLRAARRASEVFEGSKRRIYNDSQRNENNEQQGKTSRVDGSEDKNREITLSRGVQPPMILKRAVMQSQTLR